MPSIKIIASLGGAAIAVATVAGCGSSSDGQVDFAKLPPPSQAEIDRAKTKAPIKARPKFGSPAKSDINKP